MEMITKFPAPARHKIAAIFLKLALILCLLIFTTKEKEEEEAYNKIANPISCHYSSTTSLSSPSSLSYSLLEPSALNGHIQCFTGIIRTFFNETFPRIVASGITMYLGVCCVYVGSVHLKWLKN